jgi:hypothetical protein
VNHPSRVFLSLVFAAAFSLAATVTGQTNVTPPPGTNSTKLDNLPLSKLYTPGTNTISPEKKRELYSEASIAYVKKFPLLHPENAAQQDRIAEFFLPSPTNHNDPEAFAVFSGMIDVTIKKGLADSWTAYRVAKLVGDGYVEELNRPRK